LAPGRGPRQICGGHWLNGIALQAYFNDLLTKLVISAAAHINEFMPWAWAAAQLSDGDEDCFLRRLEVTAYWPR
jgi:hypothetical protein